MSACKCECGDMGYTNRAAARKAASRLAARRDRQHEARVFGTTKTNDKPGKRSDGFHGRRQHCFDLIEECWAGGYHVEQRERVLVGV